MPEKCFFTLLLVFTIAPGCGLFDRQSPPSVVTPPPYLQSQNQQMHNQLAELRVFHEKESAQIAEDMHVVRNREMERLGAVGKELEKDRLWQEDYAKTLERRSKWASWFKKGS